MLPTAAQGDCGIDALCFWDADGGETGPAEWKNLRVELRNFMHFNADSIEWQACFAGCAEVDVNDRPVDPVSVQPEPDKAKPPSKPPSKQPSNPPSEPQSKPPEPMDSSSDDSSSIDDSDDHMGTESGADSDDSDMETLLAESGEIGSNGRRSVGAPEASADEGASRSGGIRSPPPPRLRVSA